MTANVRYCPRCRADVEEVDGHCLLGHNLRLAAPSGSLNTLRDEIDSVFEEAQVAVAVAVGGPQSPPAPRAHYAPTRFERPSDPPAPPAPKPVPPPSLASHPVAPDPIAAFAPPPTMDWGPQRARFLRRRS